MKMISCAAVIACGMCLGAKAYGYGNRLECVVAVEDSQSKDDHVARLVVREPPPRIAGRPAIGNVTKPQIFVWQVQGIPRHFLVSVHILPAGDEVTMKLVDMDAEVELPTGQRQGTLLVEERQAYAGLPFSHSMTYNADLRQANAPKITVSCQGVEDTN